MHCMKALFFLLSLFLPQDQKNLPVLRVGETVKGVIAVDLDALYLSSETADWYQRLPQNMADWEVAVNKPAKLLTVNSQGITLTEMTI